MKRRQLLKLGIPPGLTPFAQELVKRARYDGVKPEEVRRQIIAILDTPTDHLEDEYFGSLARQLDRSQRAYDSRDVLLKEPAPWKQWGENHEVEAIKQMHNACMLPIAVKGAVMADAHVGYGLNIGGVWATRNSVVPYAVGVDIACRMRLSILDMPANAIEGQTNRLINAIEKETAFGLNAHVDEKRQHDVMDEDWTVTPISTRLKDKAHVQLGSSGSGNHFVEFGVLTLTEPDLGLEAGTYLALLSHSGSRGTGAQIADYYSKLAMAMHPHLPKDFVNLSWLDLDTHEGQEYWAAMELMGKYAAANHELIHKHVTKAIGAEVIFNIDHHHNFAWKEVHDDKEVIVHRKGACPAGEGVLNVIPGSMATTAYIARGKGNPDSLNSSSHGAGRCMSRKQAKKTYTWSDVKAFLKKQEVHVISAGLDECPWAYKKIEEVMAAQKDLVETVATFEPKIVKMAPGNERPED